MATVVWNKGNDMGQRRERMGREDVIADTIVGTIKFRSKMFLPFYFSSISICLHFRRLSAISLDGT